MKPSLPFRKEMGTLLYRLKRHPAATALSVLLVIVVTRLLIAALDKVYPELSLENNLLNLVGAKNARAYKFFTGSPGGAYYAIGEAVKKQFAADGDSIDNVKTSGGEENAFNLTFGGNSFAMVQADIINHDEQLRKSVHIVTPLFLERMHVFYRKDLFPKDKRIQLSADIDTSVLRCFNKVVKKVNAGPVGSGTRVLASYVLTLIGRQLKNIQAAPNYIQTGIPNSKAFPRMLAYNGNADSSTIDLLFYLGADPINLVKNVLDSNRYGLLSIDPSFIAALNKEFGLHLWMADFKDKYEVRGVSTFGTPAYLVASSNTRNDDIYRMVEKIAASRTLIHDSLLTNADSCNCVLPLNEFGFLNSFTTEYKTSQGVEYKQLIAVLLSVITLFFPVFKSITGTRSVITSWNINRDLDAIVKDPINTPDKLLEIKRTTTNLYGSGVLSERHYRALMERIKLYLDAVPEQKEQQGTVTVKKIGVQPHVLR